MTIWYSSTDCQKSVEIDLQPIRAYQPYFGQILTRRHRTARRDWCCRHCASDLLIWILFCFPTNVGLTFAKPTDARKLSPSGRAFYRCVRHWAGPFRSWFSLGLGWDNIQCYVNSMHCRITPCIAQNGGHMRY